jgi:hypothetical protein
MIVLVLRDEVLKWRVSIPVVREKGSVSTGEIVVPESRASNFVS